jgi:hypothetical protein
MAFSRVLITPISAFEGKISNNLLLYYFPVSPVSPFIVHSSSFTLHPSTPRGIHYNLHTINTIKYFSTSTYFDF